MRHALGITGGEHKGSNPLGGLCAAVERDKCMGKDRMVGSLLV